MGSESAEVPNIPGTQSQTQLECLTLNNMGNKTELIKTPLKLKTASSPAQISVAAVKIPSLILQELTPIN